MAKALNLVGPKFGKLTVLHRVPAKPKQKWLCQCECGEKTKVVSADLRSGRKRSCGCISPFRFKHGMSGSRLESIYKGMKQRCYSEKHKAYRHYGGRGIGVCEGWRTNPAEFYSWALANGYEEGLELDRIDVDGNYCPENCRFVTHQVNCQNRRVVRDSITKKAQLAGLSPSVVISRLHRGWDLERALSTPLLKEGRK